MNDFIIAVAKFLVVPVIMAWATVLLSLRKFRRERWWERKFEAYSRLIDSLHCVLVYYDTLMEDALGGEEIAESKWKAIADEYQNAYSEVSKQADIGFFIISESAVRVLQDFLKRPRLDSKQHAPFEFYEAHGKSCKETIRKLREAAKEDLRI